MEKSLKTLLESINAQIEVLVKNGYGIYDADNSEYFISKIRYDSEDDVIKFETQEDVTEE